MFALRTSFRGANRALQDLEVEGNSPDGGFMLLVAVWQHDLLKPFQADSRKGNPWE